MSETTGTPELNAALAKLQASLPRVSKGETAKVPGKEGKTGYSYKYADLADISATVLPVLGKLGLAWTAKPTMLDGSFVLHYKLRHVSGEMDEGFYPLPSPERAGPQQVGSAITYARRYCLCAVTGIHPDGEDDDAARAQSAPYSAADAWENATPAPRRDDNGRPMNQGPRSNGHTVRPAASEPRLQASGEPDPDAQPYADEAHEARTLAALQDIQKRAREAGKLTAVIVNPATQGKGRLAEFIDFHRKRLTEVDAALAALHNVAKVKRIDIGEVEIQLKLITGKSVEDATPAEMRSAAEQMLAEVSV